MSAVAVMPLPSVPTCARAVHARRGGWLAAALIVLALGLLVLGTAVGSMGFENLLPALWSPQADPSAQGIEALRQKAKKRLPKPTVVQDVVLSQHPRAQLPVLMDYSKHLL